MKHIVISLVGLALSGCATSGYKSASAGQVGCPEQEISISNENKAGIGMGSYSWTASCRGKTYQCSSVPSGGIYGGATVGCKEEVRQPATSGR